MKFNFYSVLLTLIITFAVFQYGRTYDVGVTVYQPEYNHVVRKDLCEIVQDTSSNTLAIWYRGDLYMLDTVTFKDL